MLVRGGAAAPGVVCDQSRWLAQSGEVCPLCGNPTRPTTDVIDELAQVVISEGGAIHHINSGGARLMDHDIGADLRSGCPNRLPTALTTAGDPAAVPVGVPQLHRDRSGEAAVNR